MQFVGKTKAKKKKRIKSLSNVSFISFRFAKAEKKLFKMKTKNIFFGFIRESRIESETDWVTSFRNDKKKLSSETKTTEKYGAFEITAIMQKKRKILYKDEEVGAMPLSPRH